MLVRECNFRDLYHRVCFIECADQVQNLKKVFSVSKRDNGVLAYGYIDHEEGLTFEVLAPARLENGILSRGIGNNEVSMKFRRGSVNDREITLYDDRSVFKEYDEKFKTIDTFFNSGEAVDDTRMITEIDGCRHLDFPDDILAYAVKAGLGTEGVWLRCEGVDKKGIKAKLLNNTEQDFGVKAGDEVRVHPVKDGEDIICIVQL